MRTAGRCHVKDLICTHALGIHLTHLCKCGSKEHLAEHIQTVVARRSVRTDRHGNALIHETLRRTDAGSKLQIGSRVRHSRQVTLFKDLKIRLLKPYAMVSAAAVLIHAKRIRKLCRCHAPALFALCHLKLCLGIVQPHRRFQLLCQRSHAFHQFF